MVAGDTVIEDYRTASTTEIASRISFLNSKPVNTDYTDLEKAEILMAIQQLQSRVDENPANRLEVSNSELISLKSQIEEAKKDLKISEERVATLRHPEKDKSYYESWFPINRPLTNRTIIIILAIGVFFMVISFLIVLRLLGFDLQFSAPWENPTIVNRFTGFIPPFISQNFSKIVSVIMIIVATVSIVLYATRS
jgi:DNA-binding transcriptional regulator YhcF (GntR family)